jgi:hypothetical protein
MPAPFDPARLLEVLGRHDVEFVLIGGLAGALHGSPAATNDADICPARTPDNLSHLAAALVELGAAHPHRDRTRRPGVRPIAGVPGRRRTAEHHDDRR